MTVWDSMALNAPATARELVQDGEPAPGSTTEPENATCPSAGGFGVLVKPLVWVENVDSCLDCALVDNFGLYEITEDAVLFSGNCSIGRRYSTIEAAKAAAQADYEARILSALKSIVTPQAILTAIAAEKATWPHAGALHDGARKACDNIATRIKQLMGDDDAKRRANFMKFDIDLHGPEYAAAMRRLNAETPTPPREEYKPDLKSRLQMHMHLASRLVEQAGRHAKQAEQIVEMQMQEAGE